MSILSVEGVLPVDKVLQAPRLAPIAQFISDHMVDIYVGEERKKFRLHRDLLCERSEFFQASFGGQFKEAEAQELALPEDSVESFGLLLGWLYGAPLVSISSEETFPIYLDLVILAQKLCLEHLQNETMDHILRFCRLYTPELPAHTIRSIYGNTSTGDPLRRLIIRCVAWTAVVNDTTVFISGWRDLLEGGGDIAVDFTSWLAKAYASSKGNRKVLATIDPRRESNCSYHKHISTPPCSDPSKLDGILWLCGNGNGSGFIKARGMCKPYSLLGDVQKKVGSSEKLQASGRRGFLV